MHLVITYPQSEEMLIKYKVLKPERRAHKCVTKEYITMHVITGNSSSRFSINSEAFASEFLENLGEMFIPLFVVKEKMSVVTITRL